MRIDAHQHFWDINRLEYGWLTPQLKGLYRPFEPKDLHPLLAEHRMDYTILVQAAPTLAESEYLLDLYRQHAFIAGVVGWVDLDADDAPRHIDRLKQRGGLLGVRPMLQDIPDETWILRPRVLKNLAYLRDADLSLDLLIEVRHLETIPHLLEAVPGLRAVIDHAAKPNIAERQWFPWRHLMTRIAGYENVMCKLSGLITEAAPDAWRASDLEPYVSHLLEAFGPQRVMFGSDWPVCNLAGSYGEVVKALEKTLPKSLSAHQTSRIFGGSAADFYRIGG